MANVDDIAGLGAGQNAGGIQQPGLGEQAQRPLYITKDSDLLIAEEVI